MKPAHQQEMIAKCEDKIADLQAALAAGEIPVEEQEAAFATIDDMINKIERLNTLATRLDAVKKPKK